MKLTFDISTPFVRLRLYKTHKNLILLYMQIQIPSTHEIHGLPTKKRDAVTLWCVLADIVMPWWEILDGLMNIFAANMETTDPKPGLGVAERQGVQKVLSGLRPKPRQGAEPLGTHNGFDVFVS